jgi:hypothetical protein
MAPAPTLRACFAGTCSMRDIFDEYCRDFERQRQEEASKQRPGAKKAASGPSHAAAAEAVAAVGRGSDAGTSSSSRPDQGTIDQQWAALEALLDRMRIVDRMVNQNTYADVAMDFKYWDDTSDALRWAPDRHSNLQGAYKMCSAIAAAAALGSWAQERCRAGRFVGVLLHATAPDRQQQFAGHLQGVHCGAAAAAVGQLNRMAAMRRPSRVDHAHQF